jgi:hypothetical protein
VRAVRTERYKYIRHFGVDQTYGHFTVDKGLVHLQWKDHGRDAQPYPREQLYDLALDPLERRNLAAESGMGPVLDDLRRRLEAWMRETQDVFPEGPLPPPKRTESYTSYSLKNTRV